MATLTETLIYPVTESGERLSIQMGVRPLMKDQKAFYKLIEADEDDPTRTDMAGRFHLKKTPGYVMLGRKNIFDSAANKTVTIYNKMGSVTVPLMDGKGGTKRMPRPEPVRFTSDSPIVIVHEHQPEQYAYMERVDENRDNPFRNPKVTAKFYRVDARKKLELGLEKDEFEVKATTWVWNQAKYEELIACATYANKNASTKIKCDYPLEEASIGFGTLRRELLALARRDPHTVLKGSTDIASQVKMQVIEAEKLQIIMYVDGKKFKDVGNSWVYNDRQMTSICPVEMGKNRHEAIIEYFGKGPNEAAHYTKIVNILKKFLEPNPQ